MRLGERWRQQTRRLKGEVYALYLAVRAMIARDVMEDCRRRAEAALGRRKLTSRAGLAIVVAVWILLAVAGAWLTVRVLAR